MNASTSFRLDHSDQQHMAVLIRRISRAGTHGSFRSERMAPVDWHSFLSYPLERFTVRIDTVHCYISSRTG